MKYLVLVSKKDQAGQNIKEQLENLDCKIPVIETSETIIYPENIDKQFKHKHDFDFIIFASKHESKVPNKTLSVHAPGNWGKADFGGQEGKVCKTSALFLKFLFQNLYKNHKQNKKINSDYDCTMEVTHHGPYIDTDCCFIEIGSQEEQWQDREAGEIIAKTIMQTAENFENWKNKNKNLKIAVGIGGKHYCYNFNKIQLFSKYALSHVIPDYALPLTGDMLKEGVEKTKEKIDLVILDWKSIGNSEQREKTIHLLNKLNLKYIRTSQIEKEEK